MKKRIIIFFIVLVVSFITPLSVKAFNIGSDGSDGLYDQINIALSCVFYDKDHFGVTDVDFSQLEISGPVATYEYVNGRVIQTGEFYPIIYDGHVVLTASNPSGNGFCISSALSESLDELEYSSIAVIYDSSKAYAYTGENLVALYNIYYQDSLSGERGISYRDTIDPSERIDFSDIHVTDISITTPLCFSISEIEGGLRTSYTCNVNYVTQLPYNNLCWAATIACIKNYLSGTSLTAAAVSCQCFNSPTVINVAMYGTDVQNFMQNIYSMSYTFGNYRPSDGTIIFNLSGGYPIFGGFSWYSPYDPSVTGGHAGTIYSYYTLANYKYLSVMDPTYGSCTALFNGNTYVYTGGGGEVVSLNSGLCHSW